jgi:hypothetical protein
MSDSSSMSSLSSKPKTYSHISQSPFSEHLRPGSIPQGSKKIIPSVARHSLREDFKKTFLPLLIDIFELRQMLETIRLTKQSPEFSSFGKISKSPQEIVSQLTSMQQEIEEAQRWCEGVVSQISKGIEEAQETLHLLKMLDKEKPYCATIAPSFWKPIFKTIKDFLWKKKPLP